MCPSVPVCMSVCVRIIIDFCDWDMEGDEALLLIGSLNYDFGRSEQKLKKVFTYKH